MTRLRLVATLAASLLSACAPDPPCDLRVCDIRDADCQAMATAAAACLRGVDPIAVPVEVVSREDFIAKAAAAPVTPEEEETFRRVNAGLAALNLAPVDNPVSENNAASAGNVGGVYSWDDKKITVVDDGTPLASMRWVTLLVHENVHAIQDARFDLTALSAAHATDLDRSLALGGVTEGEASYVEDLAEAGLFGTSAGDIPWQRVFANWQAWARDAARRSPLPVTLAWAHFRYPFGTSFVKGAVDARDGAGNARGWTGVDALFAGPPSGTREVEAGFGAAEPAQGPWAEDLGDDAVPIMGEGYDYGGTERMGAWLFEVFLSRLADPDATRTLPPALRGDALSFFQDRATGGEVVVWRLRASVSSSSYLLAPAISGLPAARVEAWSDDFIIVAASDAATLKATPFVTTYQSIAAAAAAAASSPAARPVPVARPSWGCRLPSAQR